MKYKTIVVILTIVSVALFSSFTTEFNSKKSNLQEKRIQDSVNSKIYKDSVYTNAKLKLKLFKKNAHASYYADKFTGRRTASGKRFDNSKYTAAHRKLPFGTRLKVTNEANGKSVIVEITDRGPFTKGRDIDLTKKSFMEIASSRYGGSLKVTIEIIQ